MSHPPFFTALFAELSRGHIKHWARAVPSWRKLADCPFTSNVWAINGLFQPRSNRKRFPADVTSGTTFHISRAELPAFTRRVPAADIVARWEVVPKERMRWCGFQSEALGHELLYWSRGCFGHRPSITIFSLLEKHGTKSQSRCRIKVWLPRTFQNNLVTMHDKTELTSTHVFCWRWTAFV